MLMNHENVNFTQIPDKTNDVIFLKSPKTLFLGHFCPIGIFSKKSGSVTHNYIWAPNSMLEKTNEPIPRKLTDRRKNGRPDSIL